MSYAAVLYKGKDNDYSRTYTFFTTDQFLTPGDSVVVRDKFGLKICEFIKYVKKPAFQCKNIIISEMDLDILNDKINNIKNKIKETDTTTTIK
jgi:hypothetical protein